MTALPDIERIRANMREHGTGRTAVWAARFKPFVVSAHGYTVHRTAAVMVNYRHGGSADLLAFFKCAGSYGTTSHPIFYEQPDQPGHKRCRRCFEETP